LRETDRGSVNSAVQESLQDDFVEFGVGSSGQKSVKLDNESVVKVRGFQRSVVFALVSSSA
jgi:hypothetical protein